MKSRRNVDPDSLEKLKRIPTINNLLKDIKLTTKPSSDAGFMFLSRFNKDEFEDIEQAKVKEKTTRNLDSEGTSLTGETKSLEAEQVVTNNSERNRRYALSLATLAAKPYKRLKIVNEGAISLLIELSNSHDKTIQLRCAAAFASLSSEPTIRARMIDEGVVPILTSLATNSNIREIKVDCCRAICNLCCVPGYEFKMAKEGVPFTIMNIAAACPDTFDIGLQTLLNISCVADKFARIEDLTEALFFFLSNSMTISQETLLLSTFCNLSSLRNNQLRLVEDGCLKIIEKYNHSKVIDLRRRACEILKNLTTDYRSRAKLLEMNIINIIVEMSEDPDEDIRLLAAKCFLFLSKDAHFRNKFVKSSAFSMLLKACQPISSSTSSLDQYHPSLQENLRSFDQFFLELCQLTAKTIRILCSDEEIIPQMNINDISQALLDLMENNEDMLIQQCCCESLCCLYQYYDLLKPLLAAGTHQILVELAKQTKEEVTKQWCAFAFYLVVESKLCDEYTLNNQILPCLLTLIEEKQYITKLFCSAALSIITINQNIDFASTIILIIRLLNDTSAYLTNEALHPKEHVKNPRSGTIPYSASGDFLKLDSQLLHESNENFESTRDINVVYMEHIQKYLAIAMYHLSKYDRHCYLILDQNGLIPVVKLTQYKITKVISAGIISRLSLHKQYYDQFLRNNVLKVLLELSLVDDRITQRRVVNALSNLSQNETLRSQLLQLNPISYIISLASERDEYLRRGCIAIVCNISYLPGSEKGIIHAGIIPTLMITSLITTDQLVSRIICVKALLNLMADRTLYTSMVKDGVIWALSKLGLMGNIELCELCALALCRLSLTFARPMIGSSVTIKMILLLVEHEAMYFRLLGARMLTNLLLETNEHDEDFRNLMVQHMCTLISPTPSTYSEELNELVIICLCLISQSEPCRITIVSTGMLMRIDPSMIFSSDAKISFAYVMMFQNIANNPMMRIKVLDENLIERLHKIIHRQLHPIVPAMEIEPSSNAMSALPEETENDDEENEDLDDESVTSRLSANEDNDMKKTSVALDPNAITGRSEATGDEDAYSQSFVSQSTTAASGVNTNTSQPLATQSTGSQIAAASSSSSQSSQQQPPALAAPAVGSSKLPPVPSALDISSVEAASPSNHTLHENLILAVAKALYVMSCASENIPRLVSQKILQFIEYLFTQTNHIYEGLETPSQPPNNNNNNNNTTTLPMILPIIKHSSELTMSSTASPTTNKSLPSTASTNDLPTPTSKFPNPHLPADHGHNSNWVLIRNHLIACLYNLTTHEGVAHELVSSGLIKLYSRLWNAYDHFLLKDFKMVRLLILSVCYLACAKTNSNRMVNDGCTEIINFIGDFKRNPHYSTHSFAVDVYIRCSAAYRNLLSIISNQQMMVAQGCLPVLITLTTQSYARGNVVSANNSVTTSASTSESKAIRANCAAALKSLTYNEEIRQSLLLQNDAISIILGELRKETDMNITPGLLRELEAESWENGSRTKLKEGRFKLTLPSDLHTDYLLKGVTTVQLNVTSKDVELMKYYVQVTLEDESERPKTSSRPPTQGRTMSTNSMDTSMMRRASTMSGMAPVVVTSNAITNPDGPDSPNQPTIILNSSAIQRQKLHKMMTEVNLIPSSSSPNIGSPITPGLNDEDSIASSPGKGSITGGDSLVIEEEESLLTMDNLTPMPENDDSLIGLMPQRYGKKEVEIFPDPQGILRVQHIDDSFSFTPQPSNIDDLAAQGHFFNISTASNNSKGSMMSETGPSPRHQPRNNTHNNHDNHMLQAINNAVHNANSAVNESADNSVHSGETTGHALNSKNYWANIINSANVESIKIQPKKALSSENPFVDPSQIAPSTASSGSVHFQDDFFNSLTTKKSSKGSRNRSRHTKSANTLPTIVHIDETTPKKLPYRSSDAEKITKLVAIIKRVKNDDHLSPLRKSMVSQTTSDGLLHTNRSHNLEEDHDDSKGVKEVLNFWKQMSQF